MVATTSAPNRIAPYLSEPTKTLPPLPADPAARSALLSDAVFAAVLALQGQLTHHDPEVVQKAAEMILDFEKTRLRHGRAVAGTIPPSTLEPLPRLDQLPGCDDRPQPAAGPEVARALSAADAAFAELDELDEPEEFDDPAYPELDAAGVGRVRAQLQAWADEKGAGQVVSWDRAVSIAKQAIDRQRQRANAPPAVLVDADIPRRE